MQPYLQADAIIDLAPCLREGRIAVTVIGR